MSERLWVIEPSVDPLTGMLPATPNEIRDAVADQEGVFEIELCVFHAHQGDYLDDGDYPLVSYCPSDEFRGSCDIQRALVVPLGRKI